MAFDFYKLKDELVSAMEEVEGKVTDASEVAKKKYDIRVKEDLLEKQFAEFGRTYYYKNKDSVQNDEAFADIRVTEADIERLKDELLTLQGAVECPSCGLKQSKDNTFCSSCGAAMR